MKNHENHENYRCVPQIASPEERKIQNTLRRFRNVRGARIQEFGLSSLERGSVAYIIDSRAKRSPRPSRGGGGEAEGEEEQVKY